MRYVVTGGLGFIGSSLARHLVGLGHKVTVVDARSPAGIAAPGAECVRADVTDRDAMRSAVRGSDGVFHLAALTSAPESIARPEEYERVNVGGTRAVLGAAALAAAPVVLASSAAVYGSAGDLARRPLGEDTVCEPANPYGATKLECERALSARAREGSPAPSPAPAAVSLRLFNVYGPSPPGAASAGVVARFAALLAARQQPVVSGDGLQVRDYVHVEDVARAFAAAMRMASRAPGFRGAFNVGTGRGTTVICLARAMARAAGQGGGGGPRFGPAAPGDVGYSVADTRRAASALGWRASVGLDDGLRRLLAGARGGEAQPAPA